MRLRKPSLPATIAITSLLAVTWAASDAVAQACGSNSGRYVVRLQPGLLVFPNPTPDDFAAARTSFFPSIQLTVQHILEVDRYYLDALEQGGEGQGVFDRPPPSVVCMRADSPDMGNGKPISHLQYRQDAQSGWTPLAAGDQLLAQGGRGRRIFLQFRILLDAATDPAGSYSADYTVTASRQ